MNRNQEGGKDGHIPTKLLLPQLRRLLGRWTPLMLVLDSSRKWQSILSALGLAPSSLQAGRKTRDVNSTAWWAMTRKWQVHLATAWEALPFEVPSEWSLQSSHPSWSLPQHFYLATSPFWALCQKSAFGHVLSEYCLVLFLTFVPCAGLIPLLNDKVHNDIGCDFFVVNVFVSHNTQHFAFCWAHK